MQTFHNMLKAVYRKLQRTEAKIISAKAASRIANLPSYYPEIERKPFRQRLIENRQWARKYAEPNEFYTLYGFDLCEMGG